MNIVKVVTTLCIFSAALWAIGYVFWEEELKYTRPTPVPEAYVTVPVNQLLDQEMVLFQKSDKPKHLHFYNPACPCSKFNLSHFSSLVKKYRQEIDFYVVVPAEEQLEEAVQVFGSSIHVMADADEKLAKACGVYATPQAVLIDTNGKLYYRGNYNKARYCTSVSSDYARIAIDSLLANKPAPHLGVLSTTAYGCELDKKSWLPSFTL